jgi:hypothetical protein
MKIPHTPSWTDFFRDARDMFSAFTVISLLAGFTLVSAPMACRVLNWPMLTRDEITSLTLLYCISALSDALLGVYLNKAPDAVAVNQQFGEGAQNTQTSEIPTPPPSTE